MQGGLVGFELGEEDFTIELFAGMKVNYTSTVPKQFYVQHQAWNPANSAWGVGFYKTNTDQQLYFNRGDDTGEEGYAYVDFSPLQNGFGILHLYISTICKKA